MFNQNKSGQNSIDTDILIIGSGSCAAAIASQLEGGRHEVTVIESGKKMELQNGESLQMQFDSLVFENKGIKNFQEHKIFQSQRAIGGQSNYWSGNLAFPNQSETEFILRKNPDWDISYESLLPYNLQAMKFFIPNFNEEFYRALQLQKKVIINNLPGFEPVFHLNCSDRHVISNFWKDWRERPKNNFYQNMHCLKLLTTTEKNHVTGVECLDEKSQKVLIKAKKVVLATGAYENPRILLLSGFENGHIGKHLMEHPSFSIQEALLFLDPDSIDVYHTNKDPVTNISYRWNLRKVIQEDTSTLTTLRFRHLDEKIAASEEMKKSELTLAYLKTFFSKNVQKSQLWWRFSQAPNEDNKVFLDEKETDMYQMPKLNIQWTLSKQDRMAIEKEMTQLVSHLGSYSMGRIRQAIEVFDEQSLNPETRLASHPMGTTRISADENNGVVNSKLKVHGVNNLYVAGLSVFPSWGSCNPTVTSTALALRLGEEINRENFN